MNTELTTIDFESLAQWSPPKLIETKRGWKNLRTGAITDNFWHLWRSNKTELSAAGISCRKNDKNGQWEATWWMDPPGGLNEKLQENLKASQAADSNVEFPRPEGLEYLGYQKAGIAFALNIFEPSTKKGNIIPSGAGVLIGDEMGL